MKKSEGAKERREMWLQRCFPNLPYYDSTIPPQPVSAKTTCYFVGSVLYLILAIGDLVDGFENPSDDDDEVQEDDDSTFNSKETMTLSGLAASCYVLSSFFLIRTLLHKNQRYKNKHRELFFESFIGLGAILEFVALTEKTEFRQNLLSLAAYHLYFGVAYKVCRSTKTGGLLGKIGHDFFLIGSSIDLLGCYVSIFTNVSSLYPTLGNFLSSCLWLANATLDIVTERYLENNGEDDDDTSSSSSSSSSEGDTPFDHLDWEDLPPEIQAAARVLGYTPRKWDSDKDPSIFYQDWRDLNKDQEEAAILLGYTQEIWDETSPDYLKLTWRKLPPNIQQAALILGYSAKLWNNKEEVAPLSETTTWHNLTSEQMDAAIMLGFDQDQWGDGADDDDDGWGNLRNFSWEDDLLDQYDGEALPFQLIIPTSEFNKDTTVRKRKSTRGARNV